MKLIAVKDIKKVSSMFKILHGDCHIDVYGGFIHPSGDTIHYQDWRPLKDTGRVYITADVDDEVDVKLKPNPFAPSAPSVRFTTIDAPFVRVEFELDATMYRRKELP